jgi:hypothetical protein
MKHIGLIIAIIVIPIISKNQCNEGITDSVIERNLLVLSEQSQVLAPITSAAMLPSGRVVVATSAPSVKLFATDGTLLRQLGQAGRGPFEYQGTLIVRPAGDDIAIWDSGNRKLMTFSSDGSPLREWTNLSRAVTDFSLAGDTLYAYHSGGFRKDYVAIYEHGHETDPVTELGDAPGEHVPLSLLKGSSPLSYSLMQKLLLYASPAKPTVYVYNPSTGTNEKWAINDSRFDTGAVQEYSSLRTVNRDILEAAQQAMRSSRFYYLHVVGRHVLSVLQHGELVYAKSISDIVSKQTKEQATTKKTFNVGRATRYTRSFTIYLHTLHGTPLSCVVIDLEEAKLASDSPILGPTPRGFLALQVRKKKNSIENVLVEYAVSE